MTWTRAFADIGAADRPTVGGKGASLGELTRAGIEVPEGFVIATSAFERFLAAVDPEASIRRRIESLDPNDLAGITVATREIRERIEQSALPPDVDAAVLIGYRSLGGTPVAVRSSATSEDSAEASFAGLQDTYLWVRTEDALLHSVRACWASLYSVESVSYRLRLKMPESGVAMGVVIQKMVDAECAGVMFTRSPTSGDRSVVSIEACWGLGSALVSGEVTPDKFVISKVTGDISGRTVSRKTLQHLAKPGGGIEAVTVPDDRQKISCLDDARIAQLTLIGKRIEAHYGCAQDIEWAVAAGRIYVLQSRPETVWAARDHAPVAAPKAQAFEHVFALLGRRDR